MSIEKIIRKVTREEQKAETYRYWQSRSIGERFDAVWEATVAAYAMKGIRVEEMPRSRTITRVERTPKGDQ